MITETQNKYVTYVRTLQFWQSRLRNGDAMKPVYIPMSDIKARFLPNPAQELKYLTDQGLLSISTYTTKNRHTAQKYRALMPGKINPSLLKPVSQELDQLSQHMKGILYSVSLKPDAPSTLFFDAFLKLKSKYMDLFFTVDSFSNRIHTPISNFHRTHRPNILIEGQETASLDVVTMQPLLLGNILKKQIGENDYSGWINSGEDIYVMLQKKAKLGTRDEAKKRFFEILFSPSDRRLSEMFGSAHWIEWINAIKSRILKYNPHSIEKNHSNLAWLLQTTEVKLMRKVWQNLANSKIPFLSVHDEIIVRRQDIRKARTIFENVLRENFEYYRLSAKSDTDFGDEVKVAEPEATTCIPPPTTNWTEQIIELETYFTSTNLPENPLILSRPETILNLPFFINAHLTFIKANNGNPTFLPYLNRLHQVKQLLIQYPNGKP